MSNARLARLAPLLLSVALASLTGSPSLHAQGRPAVDPARRGLDVFLAGPSSAYPGAELHFALRAVGYATIDRAQPLAGATVELSWDPLLGADLPAPVRTEVDAEGRAQLTLRAPLRIDPKRTPARLFVTVTHGAHRRSREFEVALSTSTELEVIVADPWVEPGSLVGAWVRVQDRAEGQRRAGVPILVEMLDGNVARERVRVTTDATGSALVSLHAPQLPQGVPSGWQLRASLPDGSAAQGVELAPREEVPAQPNLSAAWSVEEIEAGDRAAADLRLRDAAGDPIAGAEVEWFVALRDAEGDWQEAWDRAEKVNLDAEGMAHVTWPTPAAFSGDQLPARLMVRWADGERALERSASLVVRRRGGAALQVLPEGGLVLPGVSQRLLLRARGDDGAPIVGPAHVSGDGLSIDVVLDAHGEAPITWKPPVDVGSRRDVGPCARSVAATVTLDEATGRLARRGGRAHACVGVDREGEALLVLEPPLARAGGSVQVRVVTPDPGRARRPFAVQLSPVDGEAGLRRTVWIEDGQAGSVIEVPAGPQGVWTVDAFAPRDERAALRASARMLLVPAVLPALRAEIVGGRIVPSGEVEIEARLTDEAGAPIEGLVAGLVIDAFGGARTADIERLDTRFALCDLAGIDRKRCGGVWARGAAPNDLLRAALADLPGARSGSPLNDPGGSARAEQDAAFATTLRSLEGAVFEASSSPDRLIDARRDAPRGRMFNPELFRIVTAALPTPPQTPGGEPLELSDLVAIDPQVTFDTVARRVTRLKLLRLASSVRSYRHDHDLDLDEPSLQDPNALLALLTSQERLEPSALLDPWGGTLTFRRARGAGLGAIVAALPGWELTSPGPDGRLGSGDDLADPFVRVVRSGSPYARALDEDAIVLARHDLRLNDATIDAWSALFEKNTGTVLGDQRGQGHGRLGGSHRTRPPQVRMGATMVNRRGFEPAWSVPTRTRGGVARLRLPLGEIDTTYRVILVGLADGGHPAVTQIDVPITTPIAARIETGDRWLEGDEVEIAVRVRNRTQRPVRLTPTFAASGGAAIASPSRLPPLVAPASGVVTFRARVTAKQAGAGRVEVTLEDDHGAVVDAVAAEVAIGLPGRPTVISRARWVRGAVDIAAITPAPGERALGPARLVVDSSLVGTLDAALRALEPDRQGTPDALADALESSARIELFAREGGADEGALARRAIGAKERARGRLLAYNLDARAPSMRRALALTAIESVESPTAPCGDGEPPDDDEGGAVRGDASRRIRRGLGLLEAEPPATDGAATSCWESIASSVTEDVALRGDPAELARLILSLAERPHRAAEGRLLAQRLARALSLDTAGHIALPAAHAPRRDTRALVYAAMLRATSAGARLPANADVLRSWLLVQRDGSGGFGSPLATRGAVSALIAAPPASRVVAGDVVVEELDEDGDLLRPARRQRVGAVAVTLPMDPRALTVRVRGGDGGVLVRLERELQRIGKPSAELFTSPLRLETRWPDRPRVGVPGVVELRLRTVGALREQARVRVPLPPGVSLAEPLSGVRAVAGALLVDMAAEPGDLALPKRIPIRFSLAGRFAAPEAIAVSAEEASAPAHAQAPPLTVKR